MSLDHYAALEIDNARLRACLEPFVLYAVKHGAYHLLGRNGASIPADAWVNAACAVNTPCALDADNARLRALLARVRPYLPSHGTHAEDLINDVEAAMEPSPQETGKRPEGVDQ